MNRSVRRSRFQVGSLEEGEPRPVYRRLTFVSVGPGTALADSTPSVGDAVHAGFMAARPVKALMSETAAVCTPRASLRSQEDVARRAVARKWVACAEAFRGECSVLAPFPSLCGDALCFLFLDREASTLSKHLRGWQRWLEFSRCCGVAPCSPSPSALLDFAIALAAGARLDRGRGRVAAAKGVLSALRFAAHKLGLSLASPVLESWQASDKWSAVCPKEAYPLPLWVVAKLEIAFLECGNEDAWLLGCMLLMIWGGLRWSDVQRLQLATLTIDKSSLRARCWRTKTCPSGLTFGVLFCGVTQRNWGSIFAQQLDQLRSRYPLRDFLLGRQGVPLPYASMLGQMRRCLCQYAALQPSQASGFSLHSCKATTLAWALQLDVPLAMRAAQGHHRLPNDCVAKYGRNDVWPQLQCQKRILLAVARGWQPARSLQRGFHTVAEEASVITALCPQTEQTDTESECEEMGPAAVDLLSEQEGADSDDGDACPMYHGGEPVGPWLVNTKTGWSHRTV